MDKFKQASSSFSERLKTGSASMSRLVSSKVKDLLSTPTPESKMVDDATALHLEEPDWGMNLRICALINKEEFDGTEVVRAIKRKLAAGKSLRLSLDLLEACTSNCEKVFSEVASEKVLEEMVRVVEDGKTEAEVRVKAMQLIRAWGESEELKYLPVFHQTYMNLKAREIPPPEDEDYPHAQYSLESLINQPHMMPQANYPVPDSAVHGADNAMFSYNYGSQSVEEKKEVLEITRNSLDILSSILNSGTETKPKDDLTVSMLEKCKQSLPAVQRIAESTTDDDVMLFEALNLHDQLQQMISKFNDMDIAPTHSSESGVTPLENTSSTENLPIGVEAKADAKPEQGTENLLIGVEAKADAKHEQGTDSVNEVEKLDSLHKDGTDATSARAI